MYNVSCIHSYSWSLWKQKGGRALLANGFRFLRIREGKAGNEFWRCTAKHCQARATTTSDGTLTTRGEHSHAPNPSKNKAEKVISKMRKRTREEMETVPGIYNQEIQAVAMEEDRESLAAHLPTLTSLLSSSLWVFNKDTRAILSSDIHCFIGSWYFEKLVFWELLFWEVGILGVDILRSWYFRSWYFRSWYSGTNSHYRTCINLLGLPCGCSCLSKYIPLQRIGSDIEEFLEWLSKFSCNYHGFF